MLDVADPVLRVELQARSERAALREAIALADLILQIDQYRAEARLDGV